MTQEELKELLLYDENVGVFMWKKPSKYKPQLLNKVAGNIDTHGHRQITINNKIYQAHRLAWFYVYGRWPKDQIDHINRIRDDNRFCNLREATPVQNSRNRKVNKINKLQTKGVYKLKNRNAFVATICFEGRQIYLGYFKTIKEAKSAYDIAAKKYFKDFAHE